MMSKEIIDTDSFMGMPVSARELYFQFLLRADDDGFVGNPKQIMKMVGSTEGDITHLIGKQFVFPFDSGVCVIRDWKIHNYIQSDRYKETIYLQEKDSLNENKGRYLLKDNECIQNVSNLDTQYRLGKDSIGKDKEEVVSLPSPKGFKKPSIQEIQEYCTERSNGLNPEQFFDFYESKGWKVGSQAMKDWRAAVRTWEQRNRSSSNNDEAIDIEEVIRQKKLKQCQK
jgi:hypothetical protein